MGFNKWFGLAWNYLRVHGEYVLGSLVSAGLGELPPRARRIPIGGDYLENFSGTTSACAENTKTPHREGRAHRNYLRVRGEYSGFNLGAMVRGELPPRTRRIRLTAPLTRTSNGTTSAYAENTINSTLDADQ